MDYEQIPLEEQLKKAADGFCIHPEYSACAIRAWGKTPIVDYFGSGTETGMQRLTELMKILHIPKKKLSRMTYCDIAGHINSLRQKGTNSRRVKKAMRLLAEPLADGFELWKEGRCKNAENPA